MLKTFVSANLTEYLTGDVITPQIETLDSTARLGLTLLLYPPHFVSRLRFVETGCWLWTGWTWRNPKYPEHAYGQFKLWNPSTKTRKTLQAHRFSYSTIKGPIPEGYEVDHICRVKLCVNPEHLRVVTHRENCQDRVVDLARVSESCRLGALRMWARRKAVAQ